MFSNVSYECFSIMFTDFIQIYFPQRIHFSFVELCHKFDNCNRNIIIYCTGRSDRKKDIFKSKNWKDPLYLIFRKSLRILSKDYLQNISVDSGIFLETDRFKAELLDDNIKQNLINFNLFYYPLGFNVYQVALLLASAKLLIFFEIFITFSCHCSPTTELQNSSYVYFLQTSRSSLYVGIRTD